MSKHKELHKEVIDVEQLKMERLKEALAQIEGKPYEELPLDAREFFESVYEDDFPITEFPENLRPAFEQTKSGAQRDREYQAKKKMENYEGTRPFRDTDEYDYLQISNALYDLFKNREDIRGSVPKRNRYRRVMEALEEIDRIGEGLRSAAIVDVESDQKYTIPLKILTKWNAFPEEEYHITPVRMGRLMERYEIFYTDGKKPRIRYGLSLRGKQFLRALRDGY